MASNYRRLIVNKLAQAVGPSLISPRLSCCISKGTLHPELRLPLNLKSVPCDTAESASKLLGSFDADPLVEDVRIVKEAKRPEIVFRLNRNAFIRNTLDGVSVERQTLAKPEKTIVEFSSPNIAKPFHAGHLRSAIIGNFLANLYDHLGHDVVRINYLGDWGTQFGYLKLGVDLQGLTRDDVRRNPIELLYKAYVYAYTQAANNEELQARARQIFSDLENGKLQDLTAWTDFRNYTVDELKSVYERLGISFDHYHWESQYGKKDIDHVVSLLEENRLLTVQDDGRKVVKVGNRNVPIVKSDGSTLYLTRDVAALLDRYENFRFDNALYVVDNAQSDHFVALGSIAQQLGLPCASAISHVKFGRVQGMSTRKGTVVFLKDILDEAENRMKQKQLNAKTTKIDVAQRPETSAILGTTAVIVNDLKQRRMRDYEFSWDKALQTDGDCGIKLQYTHCRLRSIQKNANESLGKEEEEACVPELLPEMEALGLICEIDNYGDVLLEAGKQKEACILVNYLFGLCNLTNRCIQTLNVKNEPSREKRIQRLLLFNSSRKILQHGMKILGLRPLEEM